MREFRKGRGVRSGIVVALVLMSVGVLFASAALAANPHFVREPVCTENADDTVTCSGKVAGLGSEPTVVLITAEGTAQCTNRGGHNPPGHIETTGTQFFPEVRNGQITFDVTTAQAEADCPPPMTPTVDFTSATVEVFQGPECDSAEPGSAGCPLVLSRTSSV